MGLGLVQGVLAQLYTNSVLRSRFFADPQAVGTELGLNSDEVTQLAQLSAQQVNLFASSLKRKRLGEVRELLPLTQRVLGKDFSKLFWRYAETHLPQGIKKHWEDAIAFSSFIEQVTRSEGIEPLWIGELVRYEKSWLQAMEPTCHLTVCRFRYAIDRLVQNLRQENVSPQLKEQPTVALWFRLSRRGQLRHFILSLPHLHD